MRVLQTSIAITAILFLTIGLQAQPKDFRISAVQEMQVWIEGGLLDGLQEGMRGEIYYEITLAGQKKRIVPAKVMLSKVDDRQAIGTLKDQVGLVNIGYQAAITPKPPNDMLTLLYARGVEAFAGKDFSLAKQFYQRILEALPADPFATQKVRECEAQIEKLSAIQQEKRNIPYYKQVIRTSLDAKDEESLKLVQTYVDKILAVAPEDPDALKYKDRSGGSHQLTASGGQGKAVQLTAKTDEPAGQAAAKPDGKASEVAPVSKSGQENIKQAAAETGQKVEKVGTMANPPEKASQTATKPEAKIAAKKDLATIPERAKEPEKSLVEPLPLLKNMVLIPESDVAIGSEPHKTPFANETPRQVVRVTAFYIDKYEVTNEDYKRFCDATRRTYPGYFTNGDYPVGTARRPVVMISWIDADAYARWAGKRLLSEHEWEAAAAGTSAHIWPWGDVWDPMAANTREGGAGETADVGSHPGDISAFGVYDMAGNVSEWTADWYQPYPGNTRKEKEYGDQFKVLRGGSFQASQKFARCQFRARLPDGFRSMDLGFRCAISARDVANNSKR